MVDLRTFVAETISQIIEGVEEARARATGGAVVNPPLVHLDSATLGKQGLLLATGRSHEAAQLVQFDVAVTATEGKGTKAGVGVVLGVLSLGAGGQSQAETSAANRVKFCVPITLPNPR